MIKKDLFDQTTGKKYHTLTPVNPKFKKEWLAMFQESLELIAADKELNGYALRVFLALLSKLDFENYTCISQSKIAAIIGIARPDVTKAISLLAEKQIIFKQEGIGTAKGYKLNPYIAWKGDVANFHRESKKYPKIKPPKPIIKIIQELDQQRTENQTKNKRKTKETKKAEDIKV
jgi:biotin operon repressor